VKCNREDRNDQCAQDSFRFRDFDRLSIQKVGFAGIRSIGQIWIQTIRLDDAIGTRLLDNYVLSLGSKGITEISGCQAKKTIAHP
jgi:hypothetical protein